MVTLLLHASLLTPFSYSITLLYLARLNYLLVLLMKVITSIEESMAASHPLFLHQALKTYQCPVVRIQHDLNQAGDNAAQVCTFLVWKTKKRFQLLSNISKETSGLTLVSTHYKDIGIFLFKALYHFHCFLETLSANKINMGISPIVISTAVDVQLGLF